MSIFIIAEIGINHNGDVKIAKKLIDVAKECGCNAVKFQKRTIDICYPQDYLNAPRESPWGTTNREQKHGVELGRAEYNEIDRHAKKRGIPWFASAWDPDSLKFLRQYYCLFNKIASAMNTHIPFMRAVAREKKTTFLSTGMSSMANIEIAANIFRRARCKFALMHSVSLYPAQDDESNLRMIKTLMGTYPDVMIGYSGHTAGIQTYLMAAEMGAQILEFHITLDRAMYGTDHAASLEPAGIRHIVKWCRDREEILGNGVKRILEGEEKNAEKLRYWRE